MLRRAVSTFVLMAIPTTVAAAPSLAHHADAPAWDRPILAEPDKAQGSARPRRTFRDHGVGPTIDTAERPRISFSLDHDTASFDLARAALARGEMPRPAEVRVEEFVKVFSAGPEAGAPSIAFDIDAVASADRRGYQVVRITAHAPPQPQRPVDVVVAVDVSAAMSTPPDLADAQELVQTLGAALSRDDRIALVELNSPPQVLLPLGPPPSLADLKAEAERLGPAEAPAMSETTLDAAYRSFEAADPARDRVLVLIGPGSRPNSSSNDARAAVWKTAAEASNHGISTYVVGTGRAEYDDVVLSGLASAGRGAYLFAHEASDTARRLAQVMRRPTAAIDPVLEVEFDAAAVTRYRMLGFEGRLETAPTRRTTPQDGALRAGDAVTVLYEVKLRDDAPDVWGYARIRYADPSTGKTRSEERPLEGLEPGVAPGDASARTRIVVLAAAVAEKLRASYWARRITWVELQQRFDALPESIRADPDVQRLGALIRQADAIGREPPGRGSTSDPRPFDRMPVVR